MEQPTDIPPVAAPTDRPAISTDITVGGRRFVASTATTYRRDMYITQLINEAGLEDLAERFKLTGASELDQICQHIILAAFASRKLFPLLGAAFEEVGVRWTMESAMANAEFFAELTSAQDKAELNKSVAGVIIGFFVSGLLSSQTFLRSSTSAPELQWSGTDSNNAPEILGAGLGISGSGTESFASSPASTPVGTT